MSLSKSYDRVLLLHNPRCAKSRAALVLLQESGVRIDVRRYLEDPLSHTELAELRRRLDRPVREWVRSSESAFRDAGLAGDSPERAVLAAMEAHPILIERPIAIRGTRALVGRPPERVLELLED